MIRCASVVEGVGRWSASAGSLAQGRPWDWGWHPMWGFWSPWGIAMMVMMLVVWGAALVGLVLGIRWLVRQGQGPRSDPAIEILRQRYARGEVDRNEFEAKKRDLAS